MNFTEINETEIRILATERARWLLSMEGYLPEGEEIYMDEDILIEKIVQEEIKRIKNLQPSLFVRQNVIPRVEIEKNDESSNNQ